MSRKTKAQKIAADQRKEAVQYTLPIIPAASPVPARVNVSGSGYSYVASDLRRIGIFTILAFGAEIFLKVILRIN